MSVPAKLISHEHLTRETIKFFADDSIWFNKLYPRLSFVNHIREQILKLKETHGFLTVMELSCTDDTVKEIYKVYLNELKVETDDYFVRIEMKGCLPSAFHKSTIVEPQTMLQFNKFVYQIQQKLPTAIAQAFLCFFVTIQKRADKDFHLDTHHELDESTLTFEAIGCKQNVEFSVNY